MASPAAGRMSSRPRRSAAARGTPAWRREEAEEEEQLGAEVEEEELQPRRRRAGKEPVGQEDEEEDYQPGSEEEGEEGGGGGRQQQQQQQQQRGGRLAGSRRPHAADAAGPSAKRGRRGSAIVKAEPEGGEAGPSGRRGAAAADDAGAPRPTPRELRSLDEKMAEYRRQRDHAAEKAEGKAPRMAMEQASRAVVRHMVFSHSEKPGVPVKRAELSGLVTARLPASVKSKAAVISYVIAHAQHYLLESLGLDMAEQRKAAGGGRGRDAALAAAVGEEGAPQYALRSAVPPAMRTAYVLDGGKDGERGLLMTVLALLHLAGGKLEEGELYIQLEGLGLQRDAQHPLFGRLPDLLKTFCARRYLQADKASGPDGEVVTYRFAEQAVGDAAEVGEPAIKRFIEQMMEG